MVKPLQFFNVAALCILLSACANNQPSQQEVALDFWSAMAAKDLAKAKTYAKPGTMDGVTANIDSNVDKIDIKPAVEKNGVTVVPTTVIATENGEQKSRAFDTVLEQEGGEWKVNFEKTTTSMMGFSMQQMMEGMGKAMGEAMKGVGEAVGKGLSGGQKP
jgi:hypothetical protein